MSENTPRKIVCTACGRTARYRPELAGKQVRCKCGHIISVPKTLEEPLGHAPVSSEAAPDDLYDIREEPKTVKTPSPAADDSPLPRAPAPSMYPTSSRPKTPDAGQERSGLLRWVIVVVILAAVIAGAIVGIRKFGGSHHPAGPQLAEEADIEQKIADEYSKDVHAWFEEDHSRILGPWSESQALAQADRWHEQGAKRVLAFGARLSMVVVIELPDDPAQRKQIFDWQADWHGRHDQKVWTDVGQKYLMIRLGV